MALLGAAFSLLCVAVVVRGAPAPLPDPSSISLPSLLTINTEEELGLYSKKWHLTPVQMCTLMGHQMTVAQPLLDINHPLVSHLPSIGEMGMSDAVMICEKVLNDEKGRVATITTVVEETHQEYSVPRDFMFDDLFEDFAEDLMDAMGFTDEEMQGAMEDNEEALIDVLQSQDDEENIEAGPSEVVEEEGKEECDEEGEEAEVQEPPAPTPPPGPPAPTPPPGPSIAETVKRFHTG